VADQLLASQGGLGSSELINWRVSDYYKAL
jgi:hypothetical protein